jgi:hypothetical protein
MGKSDGLLAGAVPEDNFDKFHEKNPGLRSQKPRIIEFDPKELEYPEDYPTEGVEITVTKPVSDTEKYYNGERVYNPRPEMG